MIKVLFSLILLCLLPVPGMLLLRSLGRQFTFAAGYVSSMLINLTVFCLCIQDLARRFQPPGMQTIKVIVGVLAAEVILLVLIWIYRSRKAKKLLNAVQVFWMDGVSFSLSFFWCLAVFIWVAGAVSYIRYVPEGAVSMMADINRLGFFGATNSDPGVMLAYYLTVLLNLPQAPAVCLVVPLSFYFTFVVLMKEMAAVLYVDKPELTGRCFFALAVLTVLGDSLFSQPYMVLHGLNRLENVITVLCVPFTFAICLRFYFVWDRFLQSKDKAGWSICHVIALLLCLYITYFFYPKTFALVGLNLVIFALLFAGRRYLPWLQSGKS